jgi:hypothetical protein
MDYNLDKNNNKLAYWQMLVSKFIIFLTSKMIFNHFVSKNTGYLVKKLATKHNILLQIN